MKKFSVLASVLVFAVFFTFTATSCHRGTGCPMNENVHVQPNKKGNYPKTKTRSGLFPKGVYKRSK
jgi:hypothetical protein